MSEPLVMTEANIPPDTRIICPFCGHNTWVYLVTYGNIMRNVGLPPQPGDQSRTQSKEAIQCGNCGKKATKTVEIKIRDTQAFKVARTLEDNYNDLPNP